MKKTSLAAMVAVSALGFTAATPLFTTTADAASYRVTKSYKYNYNTVYHTNGKNYAVQTKTIPSWSKYTGYTKYRNGSGWNYITYVRTNFFTGNY